MASALHYALDDVERFVRRTLRPGRWQTVREMRERPVADSNTVSLAPVIARQAIFVHIPKCAGITVNRTLYGCLGATHMPVALYRHYLTDREFDRFFKFTFVRNPWDRVVSAYHFLRDGGLHARDRETAEATVMAFPDFPSFVEGFLGAGRAGEALHFRPQHLFLSTRPGGEPEMDFIGRFEQFEKDFGQVCDRLGMARAPSRENAGRSRPTSWRDAYDDRSVAIVAKVYARDIALFDYAF